jgi:aminoglycoside phosphotransferase family enzyme
VGSSLHEQDEVVGFLSAPASYGLAHGEVETIATHCSIIFLVGERAFKLKRAIRFASLDYRALDQREHACRAELELNRRTAPALYLGVHSINRRPNGALAFDAAGPAVDWVVEMRRFRQVDLLDTMAQDGRLEAALMRVLGEEIARFHGVARVTPAYGGAAGIRAAIESNSHELELAGGLLDGLAVDELNARAFETLQALAPLLDERQAAGKVRQCHGDLRLANIYLEDGRPTLFDCVEFSAEVGCIDMLYDLAFLLVDLRQRGLAEFADIVLASYLAHTHDEAGLPALPLFMSVRAATRSYTLADKASREAGTKEAKQHLAAAHDFFRLAGEFLDASSHERALTGRRRHAR